MPLRHLPVILLFALTLAVPAFAADADRDGIPDAIEKRLGSPVAIPQAFILVCNDEDKKYDEAATKKNAPDILRFEAVHVGGDRLLFRITFAGTVQDVPFTFVLYADMDKNKATGRADGGPHDGTDVMLGITDGRLSVMPRNKDYSKTTARVAFDDRTMYISMDAPLIVAGGKTTLGLHLLSQKTGGSGDGTDHAVVALPVDSRLNKPDLPPTPEQGRAGTSKDYYRYVDDKIGVKLESKTNRGLTRKDVTPADPMKPGRPTPQVTFRTNPKVNRPGSVDRQSVKVNFKEEANLAGTAAVTFGFPLAQGALFDPLRIRLFDDKGRDRLTQVAATAYWPDGSVKWVKVDALAALKPDESVDWTVQFGNKVPPAPAPLTPFLVPTASFSITGLGANDRFVEVTANTGFKLRFNKVNFAPPGQLWHNPAGDQLTDEHLVLDGGPGMLIADASGKLYSSALASVDSFRVEERGPLKVVFRVEGRYGAKDHTSFMRYVARLAVWPGLHRVVLDWTHVNDELDHEFTDLQSLSLPVKTGRAAGKSGGPKTVFQVNHRQALVDGKPTGQRLAGNIECGGIATAFRHFTERWPKALRVDGNTLTFDLLPRLPEDFGDDLPHYLRFPFVEGDYRLKWGMAFTERIGFQAGSHAGLAACLNTPVVAVLPPDYVFATRAFDRFAPPRGTQFKMYDDLVAKSFVEHMKLKERQREYGFLNYGDWFGERGRNWGNNEYDLARGLFTQFVRTGNRDYYRWALAAARHQADVDMVHAYPDPYYVGANHQHSIGHTGEWSQRHEHARWSHAYDSHTAATNGHTWADGMIDGWYLSGEPRLMEACIGLGEHIAWGMSRRFDRLGSHERTAGWSLAAVGAIYRATGDPEYLAAMKRIAEVPLREQDLAGSGTWPHPLPLDHADRVLGRSGNNVFLVGILLAGLKDYHEITGDPRAEKSIVAGADWVMKSYRPKDLGWPYSASADGTEGYGHVGSGLNALVVPGLAYAGKLTGKPRYFDVVEEATRANWRHAAQPIGKNFAQHMHFAGETAALLQEHYANTLPDKGADKLSDPDEGFADYLARTDDVQAMWLRAPKHKVVYVKLERPEVELAVVRKPHGAVPKTMDFATVTVTDAAGKQVYAGKASTDAKARLAVTLAGKPGDVYTVEIVDGLRAVWALEGEGFAQVVRVDPTAHFGNLGKARMHFRVPAGTTRFSLTVAGVHTGEYGAAVFGPDGALVTMARGANLGDPNLPNFPDAKPNEKTLEVKVPEGKAGAMWSVVTFATGNLRLQLEGVPPYLAKSKESWFDPKP